MASQSRETYGATGALLAREQWTNATQASDPTPAGYTRWAADGTVATQRALVAVEAAQLASLDVTQTSTSNAATLQQRAQAAMAANRTYLALPAPTNADVVTQVRLLTQENQAVIRLVLGLLDATN